jgi:hypothetical protein
MIVGASLMGLVVIGHSTQKGILAFLYSWGNLSTRGVLGDIANGKSFLEVQSTVWAYLLRLEISAFKDMAYDKRVIDALNVRNGKKIQTKTALYNPEVIP